MNRIFKLSASVAVALLALAACTDDFLSLEKPGVSPSSNNQSLPLGSIYMKSGLQTRGNVMITDSLKKVEATAYTNIKENQFKFEKYLFDQKNDKGYFICDKNPQWPGIHRYRKQIFDEELQEWKYPEGTADEEKIPEKYSEWKDKPFNQAADDSFAKAQMGKELDENDAPVPTGYVYLEDYNEPDWLYIVDYDEPSTLEVFVYTPPLNELREAFNSGTQGKPGNQGLLLTAPVEVYDFFNTYMDGVGLKPAENYNANTELKIYYDDGVGQPGYKLGMFHVAQDISRQVDFMTGQIREPRQIYEETKTDSSGNIVKVYTFHPVDVTLKHRLCNIEVKAKNSNKDYDVDVAGVMLGRPMVYGPMFNFSTDEWEFPPLTRQDLYNPATYAYAPADAKNPVGDYIHRLGDDAVSLMGNGGNALVLPTELGAWDYHDPNNSDAYSFNNDDRPIMFLAALVRVLPKNADTSSDSKSISEIMYPFGKPSDDTFGEKSEWYFNPDICEGGGWIPYNWEYYEDLGWYSYSSEFEEEEDGGLTTGTGWSSDPETGLWSYDESVDPTKDQYAWLLNWKTKDGYWEYIGKEKGAEWEMLTDENGYIYWKYKGKYVFNPDTGKWEIPEKIIFPSKYLTQNSNFETQEFGVLKNGYPGDLTKPGSTLKPDYVLGMSYNDRDKSAFTKEEKDKLRSKNDKVEFQTYAWVGFPVAVDWKQGHKYTYTLDFTNGLGVEIPNGIYGARLISDIVKAFEEYEKTGKPIHDLDLPNPEIPKMVKSANLPQGWGSVKVESSVWEPDDIVIKK